MPRFWAKHREPCAKRNCVKQFLNRPNVSNKNDTFTVESVNADLLHYIPVLARRSRCLCCTLKTLKAVIAVFVDAYNKFGKAKMLYRTRRKPDKKSRELPFGIVDFL